MKVVRRTRSGEIAKTITKLYPLELKTDWSGEPVNSNSQGVVSNSDCGDRSLLARKAAIRSAH